MSNSLESRALRLVLELIISQKYEMSLNELELYNEQSETL